MKKITIEKTKSIRCLDFPIPENKGVYLLVGANGAGKTTLLVCLDRICNPNAFARGFVSSRNTSKVDQYENALITYTNGNDVLRFRKKSAKWAPTPKTRSIEILTSFGFREVVFIRADSQRIDIRQDEIRPGNCVQADQDIKATLNSLFETNRFTNLYRLRNSNGRGRPASYFYVIKEGGKLYSEKRFSSGELALLRLVEKMQSVSENSVILLDEAEMALHPRVQKRLLEYLRSKATEKNLLVIISTHSTSLINSTPKENIILIEEGTAGALRSITPCYPAKAIGCVDYEAASGFDYMFFVEDDMARSFLKKMLIRYIQLVPAHATASTNVIPVGGYEQTASLAVNTHKQSFAHSKIYAVLDEDAFNEGMNNPKFRSLYVENMNVVKHLGCTPEVWMVDRTENGEEDFRRLLRECFHCEAQTILSNEDYRGCNSPNLRKRAKAKVKVMIKLLAGCSGDNELLVQDTLFKILVDGLTESQIRSSIGPMLSR